MKTRTLQTAFLIVTMLLSARAFESTPVFSNGQDGYKIFRIPAMVAAKNGDLLAFCEAREGGDLSKIDLVLKRSTDGGTSWGKIEMVQSNGAFQHLFEKKNTQISVGNPAPVVDHLDPKHPGRIWLPFTIENDRVFVTYSDDHGKSWATKREITKDIKRAGWGWYATGPVHSIQIQKGKHKGRLVIPCDHRLGKGGHDHGALAAHAILSDDHGQTWRLGAVDDSYEDGLNANETTVVELNDGRLYFNTRDQGGKAPGTRGGAYSSDGGETFDPSGDASYPVFKPSPKLLDPPVVQCALLRATPELILFSGPDENGPSGKGRSDLRIRYSTDETASWQEGPLIHEGPAAYSDMIRLGPEATGVLFEAGKKGTKGYNQIVFVRVKDAEVLKKKERAKLNKPNVLFLAVDDMKDWVNCLGGYEGTVHTPHIDRLAKRGTLFTNAHCPSPKCAPSRAAIMTGLMPSTTGLYDNGHWWMPNLPGVVTIPVHFKNHGYRVDGAGKIFHHTAGNHPPNQWDAFQRLIFQDDPWFRGVKSNYPWSKHTSNPKGFPFSGVKGLGHENDWGSLGMPEADYEDTQSANFAIRFLKQKQDAPFFLACGLFRPHLPWYVPQKYLDQYALDEIVLPQTKPDDLADLPPEGLAFAQARRSDLNTILAADKHKEAIRAYLASITYADAQLGRVLDALDASEEADNTVVVLWSDHGWHLGEKQHWHKTTLWEEATRIPFIISAPDHPPGTCARPVSLVDLYPTLNELCGLDPIPSHDGQSLVPLLRDSNTTWERPARIEFKKGNAAVRSERYRYIRYNKGGEELYDLKEDPYEWNNLAAEPDKAKLKADLAQALPKTWADSKPTKGSFAFDHEDFTWTHKKSGAITHGATKPRKPTDLNVVLFLIDDLGWMDLGCQGSTYYHTPNIDQLAAEGMRFTDAYAACNVCSPTRAAVLTGKYPARLMLTQWLPAGRWNPTKNRMREGRFLRSLPLEEITLPEALREAGYTTMHVGKWHLGGPPFSMPEHHGFDHNVAGSDHGAPGGYFYPYTGRWMVPTTGQRVTKVTLTDGKKGEYLTDRLTDEAIGLIEERKKKPFFLYFPHYAVHTPLQAKKEMIARFEAIPKDQQQGKPAYAAMVESVDESVGRVMNCLKEQGIEKQTMIIFTSDNGGFAGATKHAPLRANKGSNYEGGIRVPLIIKWPGHIKPGSVSDALAISNDCYPTILEAAGLPARPHQHVDGVSLVPELTGSHKLKRDSLYWHYPHYNRHPQSFPSGMIRKGDWKLIEHYENGTYELFNLAQDPGETKDLVPDKPELVAALAEQLAAWKTETGADPMTANPRYRDQPQ